MYYELFQSLLQLVDCLKAALNDPVSCKTVDGAIKIAPSKDDLQEKLQEHNRENIKIGAKIFLNKNCAKNLISAIDNLFSVLNIDSLDNIILAYHPKSSLKIENGSTSPLINNGGDGVLNWGGEDVNAVSDIKNLWKSLETYSLQRKV